ncbi:MAG: nucleotidyltransferase [Romboutsia sp.]
MSISDDFQKFCHNLNMSDNTVAKIRNRYHQITKKINSIYWNNSSDNAHSLYAGSYGRGTAIFTSDLDIIVELPKLYYDRFNGYASNGQSQFLTNVKNSIILSYPNSKIKSDGQVVSIDFSDGISFEVVPAFRQWDGSYKHADSNNGGKWKETDPRSEISAMNQLNKEANGNLKRLCKMVRAWKNTNNVIMSGILIDTLAYRFMQQWENKDKSYLFYDWMTRDFFKFLVDESYKSYWRKPGSDTFIWKDGDFKYKAKSAYEIAKIAVIEYEKYPYLTREKWREIYGTKFPS